MKKLLLALGGVMMISSPANAITWGEFWEPFTDNHSHHTHNYGGHNHCHRHYDRGYSHCHYHRHNSHGHGHHSGGHSHGYDPHYYEGHSTEIIIR